MINSKNCFEIPWLNEYFNEIYCESNTPIPYLVHFLGLKIIRTNQKRTNEVNNTHRTNLRTNKGFTLSKKGHSA